MSNHEPALVHVATSEYQSPELFHPKIESDVGLFAEFLNSEHHAELLLDLLKGRAQEEGFSFSGQPEIKVKQITVDKIGNFKRSGWTILHNSIDEDSQNP